MVWGMPHLLGVAACLLAGTAPLVLARQWPSYHEAHKDAAKALLGEGAGSCYKHWVGDGTCDIACDTASTNP